MRVVIDISGLHKEALQRGEGFYTRNLSSFLKQLKDNNNYLLKTDKEDKLKGDVVHFPFFNPFFLTLPLYKKLPTVVTVHDLIPLKFPDYYPSGVKGSLKWQFQKLSLRGAAAVLTDSESSKKDIVNLTGYPENRVNVVYLAAGEIFKPVKDKNFLAKTKAKYSLSEKFLLYVGDINWNKNISGLIKAFAGVKAKSPQLKLVLVGSAFLNKDLKEARELKKLIIKLKLETDILLPGFVADKDLAALYSLARLYIQPSFYEGFGLPVLEAMSCGCPVLSSDQSSLPEIGAKAVFYFNPGQKNDLEKKLCQLISDTRKLERQAGLGLRRAADFSWYKTAKQTRDVYCKAFDLTEGRKRKL